MHPQEAPISAHFAGKLAPTTCKPVEIAVKAAGHTHSALPTNQEEFATYLGGALRFRVAEPFLRDAKRPS